MYLSDDFLRLVFTGGSSCEKLVSDWRLQSTQGAAVLFLYSTAFSLQSPSSLAPSVCISTAVVRLLCQEVIKWSEQLSKAAVWLPFPAEESKISVSTRMRRPLNAKAPADSSSGPIGATPLPAPNPNPLSSDRSQLVAPSAGVSGASAPSSLSVPPVASSPLPLEAPAPSWLFDLAALRDVASPRVRARTAPHDAAVLSHNCFVVAELLWPIAQSPSISASVQIHLLDLLFSLHHVGGSRWSIVPDALIPASAPEAESFVTMRTRLFSVTLTDPDADCFGSSGSHSLLSSSHLPPPQLQVLLNVLSTWAVRSDSRLLLFCLSWAGKFCVRLHKAYSSFISRGNRRDLCCPWTMSALQFLVRECSKLVVHRETKVRIAVSRALLALVRLGCQVLLTDDCWVCCSFRSILSEIGSCVSGLAYDVDSAVRSGYFQLLSEVGIWAERAVLSNCHTTLCQHCTRDVQQPAAPSSPQEQYAISLLLQCFARPSRGFRIESIPHIIDSISLGTVPSSHASSMSTPSSSASVPIGVESQTSSSDLPVNSSDDAPPTHASLESQNKWILSLVRKFQLAEQSVVDGGVSTLHMATNAAPVVPANAKKGLQRSDKAVRIAKHVPTFLPAGVPFASASVGAPSPIGLPSVSGVSVSSETKNDSCSAMPQSLSSPKHEPNLLHPLEVDMRLAHKALLLESARSLVRGRLKSSFGNPIETLQRIDRLVNSHVTFLSIARHSSVADACRHVASIELLLWFVDVFEKV